MPTYLFKTPTVSEAPIGGHRLFYFRKANVGVSVVKYAGVYSTVRYAQDSYMNDAEENYVGGQQYSVSGATKAALIAANIGITEGNFTAQ